MQKKKDMKKKGKKKDTSGNAYYPLFNRTDMMSNYKIKDGEKSNLCSSQELEYALKMLDPNETGKITYDVLLQCMKTFYPKLGQKPYEFLLGRNDFIDVSEVRDLVGESDFNFDPVKESYKVMNESGKAVSSGFLSSFLSKLGFGNISNSDFEAVMDVCGVNGKFGMKEWENMINFAKESEEDEEIEGEGENVVVYDESDSD